jgi:hypothetical protein
VFPLDSLLHGWRFLCYRELEVGNSFGMNWLRRMPSFLRVVLSHVLCSSFVASLGDQMFVSVFDLEPSTYVFDAYLALGLPKPRLL